MYLINLPSGYEKYFIYINTYTGKWYGNTSFGVPINYENKTDFIQLNYSPEHMFDMKYSNMNSKEFIDKALAIYEQ